MAPTRRGPRRAFQAAFALPLVLALAACPEADTARTLVLWHAWGGAELAALKTLIGQFKQAHPGVDVMALQVPYDKLKDKFTRSAAANGGPDLVIGDADWSGKFASSELVLRTDELFSQDELARFHPKALQSLMLGGKMYAVPESRETVALYYNKKLMPTPPKTIGEWFQRAAELDRATNGERKGLVFNGAFYFAMGYFFAEGGKLFEAGKPAVDTPGGVRALALVDRMTRSPGVMATHEYSKPDAQYKEGKAASIVNGPWALVDYQKALGPDFAVATLPTLDDGRPAASWVGVKCMMFNANADAGHRQMAKDFALFMTTPASQLLLSQQAGHVPAVKGVKLPADSPLATFQAQADVGTPVSIEPHISLVWDPMNEAFRRVLEHNATPEVALAGAQKLIEANLEAQKAHGQ